MRDGSYKYERYIGEVPESRWATVEEIQRSSTYIDLEAKEYPGAGLTLLSDGKEAYVDNTDTHTLIFGATGSKKTRLFCMPMINIFARAGESFVATDPKGELYARTSGIMKENGYDIVALNFRDIGMGDMWNPLSLPYELYNNGDTEGAISMLNDFVNCIADPQMKTTNDVFWPQMASAYALACLMLLMEKGDKSEVNLASLGSMCSSDCDDAIKRLVAYLPEDALATMNFKGITSAPDNTRMSILATLYGMVRIFNTQKSLTTMLSGNTINIKNFGKKKTAVYIIVPDEKTTYHFLVTLFIKQVYEILITEAQKCAGRTLPVRVNFVLDEFCNLPKIPDMPSMISASRSRNMRFFLVAQSMHQLKGRYQEDADTIKGNCENWVFLTSKELDLLKEISELCGKVSSGSGSSRSLISVSELQRLNKEKGEALIMHSRQYPMITEMADIDQYKMFKGYPMVKLKKAKFPEMKIFSVDKLNADIKTGKTKIPFSNKFYEAKPSRSGVSWDDIFNS